METGLLEDLNSTNAEVKFGAAKKLLAISENSPQKLYPSFQVWIKMLENKNNIFKWTAIRIIGNLSAVDTENKVKKIIPKLLALLHGGHLITSNNTTMALGIIAQNQPKLRAQILHELLSIHHDTFETDECREIAIGKVLETLKSFIPYINKDSIAKQFIDRGAASTRNATKKKAELLLKKIAQAA